MKGSENVCFQEEATEKPQRVVSTSLKESHDFNSEGSSAILNVPVKPPAPPKRLTLKTLT